MIDTVDWARATRIGLVVPGDSTVDDELWRLCATDVLPLVSRTMGESTELLLVNGVAHTIAFAESSDIEMAADRLKLAKPQAAAYVDTSISFVRGPGGDTDIADRITRFLHCPTIVTSTAVVRACAALGVHRLAVLTVYPDEINATIPLFFEPQGVQIVRMETLRSLSVDQGATNIHLGAMNSADLVAAGRAVDDPSIDAVFIPCTAVRTLEAIELLEAEINKPVLTAIQCTMWAVQRLAGVTADVPRGGLLFARC